MKYLYFLLALISMPAFAQRSVGNGGGLAEMQVQRFHESLNIYMGACLTSQNPCRLNPNDFNDWKMISGQHTADAPRIQVHFSPTRLSAPFVWKGADLTFSSDRLYNAELPKKPYQLMALVLVSRWTLLQPKQTLSELIGRAEQALQIVRSQVQSHRVMGFPSLLAIHNVSLKFSNQARELLFL